MPHLARSRPLWTGAVLTGGASTRMGRDKALLEVAGVPLAGIAVRALSAAGAVRTFAVGGDRVALEALGLEVVPDRHPGTGPLGGLVTALAEARTEVVVVLPCDLPGADARAVAQIVAALLEAPSAAVAIPMAEGRRHVLHAAWRATFALPVLRGAFAAGERAPWRAVATLPYVVVSGIDPVVLRDADRPEDLPRRRKRSHGSGTAQLRSAARWNRVTIRCAPAAGQSGERSRRSRSAHAGPLSRPEDAHEARPPATRSSATLRASGSTC